MRSRAVSLPEFLLRLPRSRSLCSLQARRHRCRSARSPRSPGPGRRTWRSSWRELAGRPVDWPGLGRLPPGPLRLIVVPDARRLDSLTQGRAPRVGRRGRAPRRSAPSCCAPMRGDLPRTLRHELAHLALHQQLSVRVPLWFDEGYAGWAAGEWDRFGVAGAQPRGRPRRAPESPRRWTVRCGARRPPPTRPTPLAVSAVTELARRNPSGTLGPLAAPAPRRRGLRGRGAGHDRAHAGPVRGAVAARRPPPLQPGRPGCWPVAGGHSSPWRVLGLVHFRRRADRARRAALDVGWE